VYFAQQRVISSWLEVHELRQAKFQLESQIQQKRFRHMLLSLLQPQFKALLSPSFQHELSLFLPHYVQLAQGLYATTHRLPTNGIVAHPEEMASTLQQSLHLLTSLVQIQNNNQHLAQVLLLLFLTFLHFPYCFFVIPPSDCTIQRATTTAW
jgi:hypothetical protein